MSRIDFAPAHAPSFGARLGNVLNSFNAARRVAADLQARRAPQASDLRVLGIRADGLAGIGRG